MGKPAIKQLSDKIGILTNLNTQNKADLVGAINETISDLNDIVTNIKAFGAKGDGITDDTIAIQNAISACPVGGKLYIPNGNFLIKGAGTEILLFTKPIIIEGNGSKSSLLVDATVPTNTDVIRISPNMSYSDGDGYALRNFSINPKSGIPARHAINLDITASGQHLKNMLIEKLSLSPFSGNGIYLTNPVNVDGFFVSVIKDNYIANGISLIRGGDSLQIVRNKLFGENYGIYVDLVSGANSLLIEANNITSKSGCVYINGGQTDPRIVFNNFESVVANDSTDKALVVLKGASGKLRTPTISFNTFSMLSNYANTGILIDNCQFGNIQNNYFGRATPVSQNAIVLTSNALNNYISKNYISGANFDEGYIDNGVGTRGIFKNITLEAGFTAKTGVDQPAYFYSESNVLNLIGAINRTDGTWLDTQKIITLPAGCRPKATQYFPATCFITNTGFSTVTIKIDVGGNVTLYGVNSKTIDWISICGISFPTYV